MHNILIIAKREYLERVRSRSFVIMTFFIPLLMLGVTIVPSMLMMRGSNQKKQMVVVSADRETAEALRSGIEQQQDREKTGDQGDTKLKKRGLPPTHFTVEISTDTSDAARAALTDKVNKKQLDAFLWATPDAISARKLDLVTRDTSSFIENGVLEQTVTDTMRREALKHKGLNEADIEGALKPVEVAAVNPLGKGAPDPQKMFLATLAMVMVMYMTVLLYGINVMRSILEEKTSRIMEVMLSTATSKQMMAGKILGVGAVGLTQVGIWAVTAALLGGYSVAASGAMSALKGVINPLLLTYFAVFFLLGYVLYSTLCAAVGSMVNSEQEAQQMQFLVMMPLILAVIFIANILQNPNSGVAVFGSLFPFTAPLVMFTRIAMQSQAGDLGWQIALSIALMVATIYFMIWLCGRIYRVGILMYGKKPTLPEILKWIKYA